MTAGVAYRLVVGVLPWLTIALLSVPVVAGVLGALAPAFGWLPVLGGERLTLAPWRQLFAVPGIVDMARLSLVTGLVSAALSLGLVVLFLGSFLHTPLYRRIQRWLSPLLAVPHAAAAIGLAFLLAPSGWVVRGLSPWATGWAYPPDYAFPGDAWGLSLILGLVVKEVPFLLLMSLAALVQCQARERLSVARSLGYRPLTAFLKGVMPGLYPLLRLPLYAVIAFATSTVDVAMILGPTTPPPLAVAVVGWLNDPTLSMRFMASAGAMLQLLLTLTALLIWWTLERLVARVSRGWCRDGRRQCGDRWLAGMAWLAMRTVLGLMMAALAGLALWSVAGYWPFPAFLPWPPIAHNWLNAADDLVAPVWQSLGVALAATLVSVVLVLGALESETQRRRPMRPWAQLILYLPLLVPSVAFLFGLVMMQAQMGVRPGLGAVIIGHAVFVLPYVFLSLAESYRRLDPRWSQQARSLGAGPWRVFWRVRLPLLLTPLLTAAAVGFAVSIGQYLPTILLGAGRVVTVTTEAVSLASGGDRRLTAIYALLQLLLPALGFMLAMLVPRYVFRRRRDLLPGTD
ncbi:putative thiamine transport system permease protein [Chromohalobacter marismortui]|uniref:Putative thiamine transport system permease protein n=1 Tax=Chromohalobacter marismortui TaxID=42055 RepID=A0A4R7NNI9_9GAMM|nr:MULTISPECIES: ABC transporter permease subunit [Chromohalobacter]MCI0509567.1 ABC transporter permease subunit [Chromohalobacter sp.]MCI0592539.1 ABC transporter permease subunit [Chromohalobacter sp.]TDU22287.1 putative thiamine transport system permease protein [Chromohalobacter marismortui]